MSVGLSMITNDAEATIRILEKYGQHFDKWFITVADKDKKQYKIIEFRYAESADGKQDSNVDKLNLSYFKWQNHFGKAREFNRQQIDTDYFFWMDSDDELEGVEHLPEMLALMKQQDLDAMYLLYRYMQNELGEDIAPHWRERLIRTKSNLRWAQTRCHETLIAPSAQTARFNDMAVVHQKDKAGEQKSMERNIKLLKQDFEETQDPRIAMYLGDNLMYLQKFDEALEYLVFLLQNGGWEEDKYRAWLKVAEIQYQKGDLAHALDACNAAEDLLPEFPDAYFLKASIYNALDKPKQTYEWVKVGMSKPIPETLSVTDPTLYEYRGIFMGALAALELGKVEEGFALYSLVRKRSPKYQLAKDMAEIFEGAFYDAEAIKKIKWLLYYSKENGGDVGKLLSGLPGRLVADPRLNADRAKLLPKKRWPPKSIVFYCGKATEAWGPDTLGGGMGGSEEAIVYLSRALAKLGWSVTVYCDREEEYVDLWDVDYDQMVTKHNDGGGSLTTHPFVTYKPWTLLNPWDEFDVFIAWRNPQGTRGIKARKKGIDLHDTPVGHQAVSQEDIDNTDFFFLKSKYQWELSATPIPKEKAVIVGNGIQRSQFDA